MCTKKIVWCIISLFCVFSLGFGFVYAATSNSVLTENKTSDNKYYLAGIYYNSIKERGNVSANANVAVVAKYKDHNITSMVVEYQKNMNVLRGSEAAKDYDTDLEVINRIIENIIVTEEAARLGISATEEEIEAFVQSSIDAYSLPEGKEMMDAYCEGAGITIEEYFLILEEQAPSMISRQNLKDEIGKQYCIDNDLEFRKYNPPNGVIEAQEAYITALFEQHKDDIVYYIDDTVTS